jgi:hypothetical protein
LENYPFAQLDSSELADVKSLESKLASKTGKRIILIAYEHEAGQEGAQSLSALADGAEPEEYGSTQMSRETGLYD